MSNTENAAVAPQMVELPEFAPGDCAGTAPALTDLKVFHAVKVRLQVVVGGLEMTIGDLSRLQQSAVLKLDRLADAPLDITLDGQVVARGHLVAVGDHFGVRVTDLATLDVK